MLEPAPKLVYPIVLVHGLCGFDRLKELYLGDPEYFRGIPTHFRESGNRVLTPKLSPMASIATRAQELRDFLHAEVGAEPVHILAHSMGGLDARYLISKLDYADRVKSLTTLGTPHRGTTFASWFPHRTELQFRPYFQRKGLDFGAFRDLTVTACQQFNDEVPDVPGVKYRAVAGVCDPPVLGPQWWLPAQVVKRAEGPNDGIVSLASATWGETTDVWNVDHLNLVNWPNRELVRKGLWEDRASAYSKLLSHLEPAVELSNE